jgi:beta-glucosidase
MGRPKDASPGAQGDYTISVGGGQPDTGAPVVAGKFRIEDQIALPE